MKVQDNAITKSSSSDEKFYTDYFIWQVVYGLPAIFMGSEPGGIRVFFAIWALKHTVWVRGLALAGPVC